VYKPGIVVLIVVAVGELVPPVGVEYQWPMESRLLPAESVSVNGINGEPWQYKVTPLITGGGGGGISPASVTALSLQPNGVVVTTL
jgi:hypothetical protein